jgi:hypothetical protein
MQDKNLKTLKNSEINHKTITVGVTNIFSRSLALRSFSDSSKLVTEYNTYCKEEKAAIYARGFPAIFEDMYKMKHELASTILYDSRGVSINKSFNFKSLKGLPGIYGFLKRLYKSIRPINFNIVKFNSIKLF